MAYLDFDTIVVCNNDFSEAFLSDFFVFFADRGNRNFIFTYDFDAANRSVAEGLRTFRTLKPYLHRFQPRGTRLYTAFNAILDQDIAYGKDLRSLTLPHSDRIFINLPIFTGHEWLEADLGHLVYRKHLQPLFTSFERNMITYTNDMLERFSRLPKTVFCLDVNYMTSLRAQSNLGELLRVGVPILPCISNRMSDYVGISEAYVDLKKRIGLLPYRTLCRNLREASVALRRDFTLPSRDQ